MRRLIINADDFGINAPRTHGIFQCFEQGVVTSATIIADGSDALQAAKHAREKELPCGLHLNFTEGSPTSKESDVTSLLTPDGYFLGPATVKRLLDQGKIDPVHIEREARAQVEWILDAYGPPTHLDSHHNVHIHPFIVPLLLPILDRYGIGLVRIPREHYETPWDMSAEQTAYVAKVTAEAELAFTLYNAHGIRSTDHFRGFTLGGNASLKNLRHILGKLPEGTTEIMVHPGSMTPIGTDFDRDPQRQTELRMLTDETIPELLAQQKISLCSYRDLL